MYKLIYSIIIGIGFGLLPINIKLKIAIIFIVIGSIGLIVHWFDLLMKKK